MRPRAAACHELRTTRIMFTLPFWIIFALGILASLFVSVIYWRRAIHPRLRPHFGQVVVVFLIQVLVAFFVALVLGKLVGGGMEGLDPDKLRGQGDDAKRPPPRKVEKKVDPVYQ